MSVACLSIGVAIIWLFSTPTFSNTIRLSLETQHPPRPIEALPMVDAIVVLGGALAYPLPPRREVELTDQADRVLYASRLYHAGKAPLIVVSGGTMPWSQAGSEARIMQELLMEWGVPEQAIMTESSSRTTRENALFSKELLSSKNLESILLVTSAMHMPRALASFKAVGADALPASTDVTAMIESDGTLLDWLPSSGALDGSSRAIKEYLGMLVYQLRGWQKS